MSRSRNTACETISKYFPPKTKPAPPENPALNSSMTSDDDFMSPKTVQKRKNLVWNLNKNPKQKGKMTTRGKGKSKNSKNSTIEIIQENFAAQGENLDHLQMAIALSKSTFEAEYGQSPDNITDKETNVTDILQNVKATNLERFGFKTNKSLKPQERRRITGISIEAKPARNRFKFITPILEIRTSEEREALIDTKIFHILKQCNLQCRQHLNMSIISPKLQEYLIKNDCLSLFKLDILEKTYFYTEQLNLPTATSKPGCLFKDWKAIPGRDQSPEKLTQRNSPKINEHLYDSDDELTKANSPKNHSEVRNLVSTPTKSSSDRILSNQNLSPDLFYSDNDCTLEKCSVEADYFSEINNTKREILNQVNDDEESRPKKIIDLTGEDLIAEMDSSSFESKSLSRPPSFYSLDEFENEDNNSNLGGFVKDESFPEKQNPSEELTKLIVPNKSNQTSNDPESKQTCMTNQAETVNNNAKIFNLTGDQMDSSSFKRNSLSRPPSYYSLDDFENEDHNSNLGEFPEDESFSKKQNPSEELRKLIGPNKSNQTSDDPETMQNCSTNQAETVSNNEKIINLTSDHLDSSSFKSNSLSRPPSYYSLDDFENEDHNSNLGEFPEDESFPEKQDPSEELRKLIDQASDDLQAKQTCSYSGKRTDHSVVEISDDSSSDHEVSTRPSEAQKDQEATFQTPTFSRWSCLRKSYVYNSADLNVTDYVNEILSQESNSELQEAPNTNCSSSQDSSIADEELNYSSHFSTPKRPPLFETSTLSVIETEIQLEDNLEQESEAQTSHQEELLKHISTPENYVIKTQQVTPMPEFDTMNTPMINKELQQIGVKPLKRTRGAKLLKYIYETTHPIVGSTVNLESNEKVIKRRRLSYGPKDESPQHVSIALIGDDLLKNEKPEDLMFERKQSSKIPSCAAPLQIVWHNFLGCNPQIKENILLYEPLQLESLHLMLKELGFKYHIQDLLTFLDRKCITIRIAQKNGSRHS